MIEQHREIDDAAPIVLPEQHDRQRRRLVRLQQGEDLEHLIHGSETARKDRQRIGPHRKMHLAHGKVVKLEGQFGRRESIGILLHRQADIEADGGRAHIGSSTASCLHDPGSSAGGDHIVTHSLVFDQGATAQRRNAAEFARLFVVAGKLQPPPGELLLGLAARGAHFRFGFLTRRNPRAAEAYDRRADSRIAQSQLRLFVFQRKTYAAQLVAKEKIRVLHRKDVALGLALKMVGLGGSRIWRNNALRGQGHRCACRLFSGRFRLNDGWPLRERRLVLLFCSPCHDGYVLPPLG